VSELAAVLIGGPPDAVKPPGHGPGPRLDAALLDLDVATGPLTRVVAGAGRQPATGRPGAGRADPAARYDTLLRPGRGQPAAGRPVVLVAPFSAERAACRLADTTRRLPARVLLGLAAPAGLTS